MARPSNGSNIYLKKLTELKDFFLPQGEKLKSAVSAMLRGSSLALSLVAGFTAFLCLGMLLSKSVFGPSVLRASLALTLSGFGSIVDFAGGGMFATQGTTNSAFGVGLHAGLISIVGFWAIWLFSRRYSLKHDVDYSTPIYVAFGFTSFSWLLGLISQGDVDIDLGYASVRPMSFLSFLLVFAFSWIASSRGQISNQIEKASGINQAFYWVGRALSNFVVIYTVIVIIGLIVFGIRNLIEPHFAVASLPVQPAEIKLSVEQQTLAVYAFLLFTANAFFQALFVAMGMNFGMEYQGLGSGIDFSAVPGFSSAPQSLWIYDTLGAPAFIGISVLVVIVALISGAAAAARTGIQFKTTKIYWQSLGFGLLLSLGLAYMTSLQVYADQASADGKSASTLWIFYGAYMLSLIAFSTIAISAAFLASERAFTFIASGFPTLVLRLQAAAALEKRMISGRIFGIATKLLLLAVIATPLTASTINRVSALTDGPTQLGQKVATEIETMTLKDLKAHINPTGSKAHAWLSDKILGKAQPKSGYEVSIQTLNKLGKAWEPGNLDAEVTIEFSKAGQKFDYLFDTSSKVNNPSWLLTHVTYSPKLTPAALTIQVNPQLGKDQLKSLTVNGEAVQAGTYFSVPGVYSVKSGGFKLIAPTDKKFYASTDSTIKVGFQIALPTGAASKLDKALLEKAASCFQVTLNGSSKCFTAKDLQPSVTSGSEPATYFDYADSNFKSSGITCGGTRSDKLVSSTSEASSSGCSATVTFTRTYFQSKPKLVPRYSYTDQCVQAEISDYYQTYGEVLDYRNGWNGWGYYDSNDYWIGGADRHTDYCYSTEQVRVQDGYDTIQVRGSKIGSSNMSALANKTLTVTGTLNNDNSFAVKK